MKKSKITTLAAVALMLSTPLTAFASTGPIMFGDNVYRTHENGINDPYPWSKEAFITLVKSESTTNNSSAIGYDNNLYYPVSAPNDSPTGQGYLDTFNLGSWKRDPNNKGMYLPNTMNKVPIIGVSNSSPVVYGNNVYLAAGGTFYKFDSAGKVVNTAPISTGGTYYKLNSSGDLVSTPDIPRAHPTDQNQVVSYPLYVTAVQAGTLADEVWISSQNGHLYAINPATMKTGFDITLGDRLDASPSLVEGTNGKAYIAVTSAYSPNNKSHGGKSGTGMLFIINPRTGITTGFQQDPYGPISSVASPMGVAQDTNAGTVMWNDTEGDVMMGRVNAGGTLTIGTRNLASWHDLGNGATSYFSESAYNESSHQYILPFTGNSPQGVLALNTETGKRSYLGTGSVVTASGSPEISLNNVMYLGDTSGFVDRAYLNSSGEYGNTSETVNNELPTIGTSIVGNLTTPEELMLDTPYGKVLPTLALATNQGLELWANLGESLNFEQHYQSSSSTKFDKPLTLNSVNNSLPTLPTPSNTDKIEFEMSVNAGKYFRVGSGVPTYSGDNPNTSITLSTTTLNSMLKQAISAGANWSNGKPNQVDIEAYTTPSNTFGYNFVGATATNGGSTANVTVTFPYKSPNPVVKSVSGSSGLVVPQYMLSQYFKNIVPSVPASSDSQFHLSLPIQTYQDPQLYPSGVIDFHLINPNRSLFPDWLYSSTAKVENDTTNKYVGLSNLSNTFSEEGNLLAVKADNTTFASTKLANWLPNNTSPFNVIGRTNRGTLDYSSTKYLSVPLSYGITSGTRFYYSEIRYNTHSRQQFRTTIVNGKTIKTSYTVYYQVPYEYTGVASETDYPARYNVGVTMNHYVPSSSVATNKFANTGDQSQNGFGWTTTQSSIPFNVDPEVLQFYDSSSGVPTGVFTAGEKMRQIDPVNYNTSLFSATIKPNSVGVAATNTNAQQLQNRMGADGAGVYYRGSNIVVGFNATDGTLTTNTYALTVNPNLKGVWGDTAYNTSTARNNYLTSLGAYQSSGIWKMPLYTDINLNITPNSGGANYYNTVTKTLTANEISSSVKTYSLTIRGGQLIAVNGDTNQSDWPSGMVTVVSRMHISQPTNVFNTFEAFRGSPLSEKNNFSSVNLASLGNSIRKTSGTSSAMVDGKGWYSEDTTQLLIKDYTTVFRTPSAVATEQIPMTIQGLVTPVNQSNIFTQGYYGYVDLRYKLADGTYMHYDSNGTTQFGPEKLGFIVGNATVYNSFGN